MTAALPLAGEIPQAPPEAEALAKQLEAYETPRWAADAILRREILTRDVWEPCVGTGSIALAAHGAGYNVFASDIHDWGYEPANEIDFLAGEPPLIAHKPFSVLMNPPFSKACQFVDRAFYLGARKIVCFQRFAWWESQARRAWWAKRPPNRVYICGDRAPCWRFDIPAEDRKSSSPTAHAWFVWSVGEPAGTLLGHIWRQGA